MPPRKRRQSNQGDDNGKEGQDRLTQTNVSTLVSDKNKATAVRGAEGNSTQSSAVSTSSNERRLTARQAAIRQETQPEGPASSGAEGRDRPAPSTTGTATRSSTRIVKRPRRDLSPPESPVKKAPVPKGTKAVTSTPETKTKRQWELWSVEDKNTFFEGLCEYGKDFDAIHNAIVTKYRKKGITDPTQVKNKEQVRHFYYRTWHKISKLIQPVEDLKKDIQELYGLISYGVMRRRIRGGINPADKNWQKLNELVHQGSTTVKVKGKNFRIKTPICPALKKLNNIEEPRKDTATQLPDKISLEFRPKTNAAWSQVQSLAQNPRLRVTTKPDRSLASIIKYLEKKWRPHRLKVKENMDCPEEPTQEFRVYPHRDSVFTAINLNVAEEPKLQFGLDTYKDTVQSTSPVSNKYKKGGNSDGRKIDNSSETSEAVISDKPCCSGRDTKPMGTASGQSGLGVNLGSDLAIQGPSNVGQGTGLKLGSKSSDLSAIVEGENAMFPDEMMPMKNEQEEAAVTSETEVCVKVELEVETSSQNSPQTEEGEVVPVEIDESSQSQMEKMCRSIMANGWRLEDTDSTISVAELYLMFGSKGEVHFEYEWCDKDPCAIRDTLLANLSNMLRRLANLATIEFTDFNKVPGSGSPCHMCGNVIGKQSRGQSGKGASKSPTSSKGAASKTQKDMSTQTQESPTPAAIKKEVTLRAAPPATGVDPVFRVPSVNLYPQKSLASCTLTDKELVQRINPNFSKPQMRPRKLKSVSRKPVVVQRTILPKAEVPSRQMVTFLPVVAGQPIGSQSVDKQTISNQLNHTLISQPIKTSGTHDVSVVTATSVLPSNQNNHLNAASVSLVGGTGSSPVTTCKISSANALQVQLAGDESQPLLSIPADINVGILSPETMKASGLTTVTVTTAASTSAQNVMTSSVSVTQPSISPPNISSLLEISFSNMSTVGDGDKLMDFSMDGAASSFTGLLEENKVLSIDPGLTTPPLRNETNHISPTHSPPVRSLFKMTSPTPDNQWLNGEVPDLSLTSFLESQVKQAVVTTTQQSFSTTTMPLFSEGSRDFLSSRLDVDSTLQCMMNESSVDYVRKFADLAEQIAQQEGTSTSRKPETNAQPV